MSDLCEIRPLLDGCPKLRTTNPTQGAATSRCRWWRRGSFCGAGSGVQRSRLPVQHCAGSIFHGRRRRWRRRLFAIVARKAQALRNVDHFAVWLQATATRVTSHTARSESRHRRKIKALSDQSKTIPPVGGGSDDWCSVHLHLDEALEHLPERDRRIVPLRYQDGLNFREIAGLLGKSVAAAQRLFAKLFATDEAEAQASRLFISLANDRERRKALETQIQVIHSAEEQQRIISYAFEISDQHERIRSLASYEPVELTRSGKNRFRIRPDPPAESSLNPFKSSPACGSGSEF